MGVQIHFDRFHDRIKFGRQDDAYKKARERDDSITTAVRAVFADAKFPVVSDFIQGSMATGTAVVPIDKDFDIDRALVIDASTAPTNPVDPKVKALDVLEKRGFKNAKIKKPCVTADYASENVHIDFTIYKKSGEQYYLAVGKRNSDEQNREWSASDPRGLIDWINDSESYGDSADKKLEQFRRVVRYLKRWRDWQFSVDVGAKVYSIGLAVMVKEQFQSAFDTEGFRNDLSALRQTVSRMLSAGYFQNVGSEEYTVRVLLPKQPWRDVFGNSSQNTATQFRNKLQRLHDGLEEVEALTDEREQCVILNKLFGSDFAVPDPSDGGSSKTRKAVYASAGAVGTSQGA